MAAPERAGHGFSGLSLIFQLYVLKFTLNISLSRNSLCRGFRYGVRKFRMAFSAGLWSLNFLFVPYFFMKSLPYILSFGFGRNNAEIVTV